MLNANTVAVHIQCMIKRGEGSSPSEFILGGDRGSCFHGQTSTLWWWWSWRVNKSDLWCEKQKCTVCEPWKHVQLYISGTGEFSHIWIQMAVIALSGQPTRRRCKVNAKPSWSSPWLLLPLHLFQFCSLSARCFTMGWWVGGGRSVCMWGWLGVVQY